MFVVIIPLHVVYVGAAVGHVQIFRCQYIYSRHFVCSCANFVSVSPPHAPAFARRELSTRRRLTRLPERHPGDGLGGGSFPAMSDHGNGPAPKKMKQVLLGAWLNQSGERWEGAGDGCYIG